LSLSSLAASSLAKRRQQ
nr:Chain B, MAPK DOCKING PEPTIDE [synthetic construct]